MAAAGQETAEPARLEQAAEPEQAERREPAPSGGRHAAAGVATVAVEAAAARFGLLLPPLGRGG